MGARLRKIGKAGKYYACFYSGDRVPRETSCALGVTNRNAAAKKYADLLKRWENGKFDPWDQVAKDLPMSLAEAATEFLRHKRLEGRAEKTLSAYNSAIDGLKKACPPSILLSHIQPKDVRQFIHAAIKKGKHKGKEVSNATKRHRLRHARVFISWTIDEGHLAEDPSKRIKLQSPGKRNAEFLSRDDVDRVLTAIDYKYETNLKSGYVRKDQTLWLRDVVLVAVGTGMRLGELCGLSWSHVDLDAGEINLPGDLTKAGHDRVVPLVSVARDVIERLRETSPLGGPVFTYPSGRPLVASYVSKRFKKFSLLAGLPERVHFHTLRHTAASWLVSAGMTLREVQEVLGHQQMSTTEIYSHLVKSNLNRRTHQFMESALGR
jgi:site-specific recombinase XerD